MSGASRLPCCIRAGSIISIAAHIWVIAYVDTSHEVHTTLDCTLTITLLIALLSWCIPIGAQHKLLNRYRSEDTTHNIYSGSEEDISGFYQGGSQQIIKASATASL
jgi:hypothetical protein